MPRLILSVAIAIAAVAGAAAIQQLIAMPKRTCAATLWWELTMAMVQKFASDAGAAATLQLIATLKRTCAATSSPELIEAACVLSLCHVAGHSAS
jgi:hypothetical protein